MGKAIVITGIDASVVNLGKVNLYESIEGENLDISWATADGINSAVVANEKNNTCAISVQSVSSLSERYCGVVNVSEYVGKQLAIYAASNVASDSTNVSNAFTDLAPSELPITEMFKVDNHVISAFNVSTEDGVMAEKNIEVPQGATHLLITHKVAQSGFSKDKVYVKLLNF